MIHWSWGPRMRIFNESVMVTVMVWRYRYCLTDVSHVDVMYGR